MFVVLNGGRADRRILGQDVLDVDGARLVDVRLADDLDRRERGDVRRRNARTGDDDRLGRPGLGVLATLSGGVRRILLRRRGLIGGRRIELRLRLRVRRLSRVSRARLRKRRARERDARKQRRNHVSLGSHFFPLRRAVPTEPRKSARSPPSHASEGLYGQTRRARQSTYTVHTEFVSTVLHFRHRLKSPPLLPRCVRSFLFGEGTDGDRIHHGGDGGGSRAASGVDRDCRDRSSSPPCKPASRSRRMRRASPATTEASPR